MIDNYKNYQEGLRNEFIRYGKCSKTLNSFLFLFSNKMLVINFNIRTGTHKMHARKANREYPDQAVSLKTIRSGFSLFV